MNEQKRILSKKRNIKYSLFQKENKRKFNLLLNDNLFLENNNYILRLLKKSQNLPHKANLMKREKNIKTKNENSEENVGFKKDKIELTFELDDILYNHSKSFSKSKKEYYRIKKQNDYFLSFYRFNKNDKINYINLKKNYNTISNRNINNKINEDDDDEFYETYDVFNKDNYLLMNNQNEINFHYLYKTLNERKSYTQDGPYKYINKMNKYIMHKSNGKNNTINYEQNEENSKKLEKKYNKTESNFNKRRKIKKSKKIKEIKYKIINENNNDEKQNNNPKIINNKIVIKNLPILTDINEKNKINKINEEYSEQINNLENFINIDNNKDNKNSNNYNTDKNIFAKYISNHSNLQNKDNNKSDNINNYFKTKKENIINLKNEIEKHKIRKNFSSTQNNYKTINHNFTNKIINSQNKIFKKKLNVFTNSNLNRNILGNDYISKDKIKDKNNNKLNIKIKDNELSDIKKLHHNILNYSNSNHYYNNLNKYKTINFRNNSKIFEINKNNKCNDNNHKTINNNNLIHNIINIHKNNKKEKYNTYQNKLKNILIKAKEKAKENSENISFNNSNKNIRKLNRKSTIFDLHEKQKIKLDKKFVNYNRNNIKRRTTYDNLFFYNKDLLNKKRGKNISSFLTDTNNKLNFSNNFNRKYIFNFDKGQSLNNLVDNIKKKNKNNKLIQFLKDQLFTHKNLKKMECANKYLNNFDKYFIKKYSEFQVLISSADDN